MIAPPGRQQRSAPAAARWRLRLLGDVRLSDDRNGVLRLPGRAAAALLARLACTPQRAHGREELIELLWPGVALDVGRNRLRQVLSTLKALLEPPGSATVLQADRVTIRLVVDAVDCDVPACERALAAGRFDVARALYRGELMPGFYDEWIVDERRRLAALAERIDAALAAAPMAAAAALRDGPPPPAAPAPPAVAAPAWSAPALPRYLTRVHGIEEAAAQLRGLVRGERLVTVLGPGGHGKTRLAVEVAQRLAADEPPPFDRIAFVPLVDCTTGAALLDALLVALHQEGRPGTPLALLAALCAGRNVLLVLDNVEQFVDEAAPLIATLVAHNPTLHLLLTSRRALGADGEQVFELNALPVPAAADASDDGGTDADDGADAEAGLAALAANPAVALFVDRARAVRSDFHLSRRNRAAVRTLVRRLDGMPLAIELAAARVRSLPPAQLLALLDAALQPLSDAPLAQPPDAGALALLARPGTRGAGDPRHASMLAVVQWSWRLLTPEARGLLGALAVFRGGFVLGAAQAVCGGAAAHAAVALDELVAQSMLRADADSGRYHVGEPIRLFAASTLAPEDWAGLRARHRRWVMAWARALPPATSLAAARAEVPNLVAAIGSAQADGAADDATDLACALQHGALADLSLPAGSWHALAAAAASARSADARALTHSFVARALLRAGDPAGAAPLCERALADLPAAGLTRARVLARLAHVRWRLQRDAAVAAWLDEAQALAEAAGERTLLASILATRGAIVRPRDRAAAIALQRRSLALWADAGDVHGAATGRANLAIALAESGDGCAEALALLETVLADSRTSGDGARHAHACNVRGEALSRLRRWDEAAAAYRDCVAAAHALPEPLLLGYGLWNLPRMLARQRRALDAARLMGFAERYGPLHSGSLSRADRRDLARVRRLCERQLDRGAVQAAWREGAAWPLARAVRCALQAA